MKGIRFYLEYSSAKAKRAGTRKEPGDHEDYMRLKFLEDEIAVIDGKDVN